VTEHSNGISVGCTKKGIYVRVEGPATFQNSQTLRQFALEIIERGCGDFFVDLRGCPAMDSTFMGVLAGIGLRLQSAGHSCVHLLNMNERNGALIHALGLDRLLRVEATNESPSEPLQTLAAPVPADEDTEKQRKAEVMLEAHIDLMRLDARNEAKFQEVVRRLRESIERRRAEMEKSG
jgi:anti-anti-sigma factor